MYIDGYYCIDEDCPKRWCWAPGKYEHRGATGRGESHNTGVYTQTCMHNAYHGCPFPVPEKGESRDDYCKRAKLQEVDNE